MASNNDVTIQDIVSETRLKNGKNKGNYREFYCPVHDTDSPDLCVYTDDFVCYHDGGRSGGGPISLLMHVKQINSVERAKEWLQDKFPDKNFDGMDEETIEKRKKVREVLNRASEMMHGSLKNKHEELYEFIKQDRNFDDQTMEETQIGFMSRDVIDALKNKFDEESLIDSGLFYKHEGDLVCQMYRRIVFPYSRGEQVWYMIGRKPHDYKGPEKYQQILSNSNAKYKKLSENKTLNKHIVYEWHQDSKDSNTVIITEGVTDAISAHAAGYNVSSPVTTQYSDEDIQKVVDRVRGFENIYIIMDADNEGWKGAKKTGQELAENGVEAQLVKLDEGDLDDWTCENSYEIDNLLENADYYFDLIFEEIEDASRRTIASKKRKLWRAIRPWSESQRTQVFKEMPGSKRDNRSSFNTWLEEKEEKEKKERKPTAKDMIKESSEAEQDGESEDDDNKVTSRLDIGSEELDINPSIPIIVNRLLATDVKMSKGVEGVIDTEPSFKVYEIQFAEGENQDTFKLVTKPHKNIRLGKNLLPVKKPDLMQDQYFGSNYFQKEYRRVDSNNEDFNKSYKEWLRSEQDEYLELSEKLSIESREKISELSNDEILNALKNYQISGYHTDTKLRSVMFPQIIQHDKTQVDPEQVAKYQPHTQMWTNTKVGKSTTSERIGRKIDDATIAGLVGYADTDGKQEGVLDGLKDSVFIDEFNFGASSQQLNDQLLSVMETGKFEQSKAGRRIMTRFYGAINYMANPKESDNAFNSPNNGDDIGISSYQDSSTSLELISKFEELISFLGFNIEAMGSRFGVILFDQEMDRAEELEDSKNMSRQEKRKLETFVQWLIDSIRPKYTEIERKLSDWLEQDYPEDYKNRINEIATTEIKSSPVLKFWRSHIYSYRHARGQALRKAVYLNIGDVLNDNFELEKIREEADDAFDDVKQINIQSLKNMTKVTDEKASRAQAESVLESEDPLYSKLLVKTIIQHWSENDLEHSRAEYQPFTALKESWQDIKMDLTEIDDDSMYWKWNKLSSQIKSNMNKISFDIEQRYGIKIRNISNTPMVSISKPENFERFEELEIAESEVAESMDNQGSSATESGSDDVDRSNDTGKENQSDEGKETGSNDVFIEEDDLKIKGDYSLKERGILDLFKQNESSYENSEIPYGDLKKYFGRRVRNPSKLDELEKLIDSLRNNGLLIESSTGKLRRGSSY